MPAELIFNVRLSIREKVLLFFGWHIQVRVYGPCVQWGISRKPMTEIDKECLNHAS